MKRRRRGDKLYGDSGELSHGYCRDNTILIQPTIVYMLAFLIVIGLFGFFSISFAEEGKWTKKSNMPTERWALSSSVANGKIYVIGGTKPGRELSTVEEYDPLTDKWTKKADMPTARSGLSTSVVNEKIYAIGGSTSMPIDKVLTTVEEYDPLTDKWTKKADMPTARAAFSTDVVNGKIYAIGGINETGHLSTVEEYDTGFAGLGIEAKGKLVTSWGKIKAKY